MDICTCRFGLNVLTLLLPQTGPKPGYEGGGIQQLWEKCAKKPQHEPRCLYSDSATTGLPQVRCWWKMWKVWFFFFLNQGWRVSVTRSGEIPEQAPIKFQFASTSELRKCDFFFLLTSLIQKPSYCTSGNVIWPCDQYVKPVFYVWLVLDCMARN